MWIAVGERWTYLEADDVIEPIELADAHDAVDVVDACELVDANEIGRIGDNWSSASIGL